MSERTWRNVVDKSAWGPGPWHDEDDKVHWVDADTGLDCLIVRGPVGNWNGYVGVPEGHPLFGVPYNEESEALTAAFERLVNMPSCEVDMTSMPRMMTALFGGATARPNLVLTVHGGLTYSDWGGTPDEEFRLKVAARVNDEKLLAEVRRYPIGDAARALDRAREAGEMDSAEWVAREIGKAICHDSSARPARLWWFGFDCNHYGDLAPGMVAAGFDAFGGSYRMQGYAQDEVVSLARQLGGVGAEATP